MAIHQMMKLEGKSWKTEAGAMRAAQRTLTAYEDTTLRWLCCSIDGRFYLLVFLRRDQTHNMLPLAHAGFHVIAG